MQYIDFERQMNCFVVFSINDIEKYFPDFNKMNLVRITTLI